MYVYVDNVIKLTKSHFFLSFSGLILQSPMPNSDHWLARQVVIYCQVALFLRKGRT